MVRCICSLCPSLRNKSPLRLRFRRALACDQGVRTSVPLNSSYLRCFFFSLTTLFQPALEGTDQSQGSRAVLMTGTEMFSGSLFFIYKYILRPVHLYPVDYQSCTYLTQNERGSRLHITNIQPGALDGATRGKAFSLIRSLWTCEHGVGRRLVFISSSTILHNTHFVMFFGQMAYLEALEGLYLFFSSPCHCTSCTTDSCTNIQYDLYMYECDAQ